MGIWSRVRLLLNTEVSSALDQAEDPRQVLDYAYNQQQQLLITLRRGLVDVATSKQQLEHQARRLETRIPQLDDQARRAVEAGRDDLARVALERKRLALSEVEGLTKQIAEVESDKQRLAAQERTLQVRVEQFRTHREVVSARYTAAEAEVRLKEFLARASRELAELSMPVGRAEDLEYGQTGLVWDRWILIGTGILHSFWRPTNLVALQVQLAAIVALAFGKFYLHVQLLRGRPARDSVVYAASLADIGMVTA